MHEITIECLECRNHSIAQMHHIRRFEYHLDFNLDLIHSAENNLQEMITNYFKTEKIDQYCCIKCSIRQYLLKFID